VRRRKKKARLSAARLAGRTQLRRGRGGDESQQRGAHGHPVSVVGGVGMMAWKVMEGEDVRRERRLTGGREPQPPTGAAAAPHGPRRAAETSIRRKTCRSLVALVVPERRTGDAFGGCGVEVRDGERASPGAQRVGGRVVGTAVGHGLQRQAVVEPGSGGCGRIGDAVRARGEGVAEIFWRRVRNTTDGCRDSGSTWSATREPSRASRV